MISSEGYILTMRSSLALSFLFVAILAALVACAEEKLQIGVKFRPEECSVTSKPGDTLSMHYTGSLAADGSVFDSSVERGTPFKFTLGKGQVIKGWDQGLLNMCVGEKRKLKIPPSLGYGAQGAGGKIPGGATLIFETELLEIN